VIKKPGADGKSTVRAVTSPAALTVEVPWLLQTNSVVVMVNGKTVNLASITSRVGVG